MIRTTSLKNWEQLIKKRKSIIPPPIFKETAEYALSIFKSLRVADIQGQPTLGKCCEEWVFDFVKAIFGAYDRETGNQLIKEFFLMIPKKNSKSTIAAAIMLTALIINWRRNEELLILAPTKEIALNSFEPAAAMVRLNNQLSSRFTIRDHLKTIICKVTKNSLKVISADDKTAAGKKAGIVLIDEVWVFGKMGNTNSIFTEALGGQVSRPEGFTIYLTTQSDIQPAGIFKDKLNYFRDIRDGKIIDNNALPIIYEFPNDMIKDESYKKPENWKLVNPNLGKSVQMDWLVREFGKVQLGDNSKEKTQQFFAKHLNVEVGLNLASDRWAGADFWLKSEIDLTLDGLISQSEVITVGIDGGGLDDLLGFYVIGRKPDGLKIGWGYAWAHDTVMDRRKEIANRLNDFKNLKELSVVKKIGDDIKELVDMIVKIEQSGKLNKIGVDPSGISTILEELHKAGFDSDRLVGISQGWKLGGIIKTVERWLATDKDFKVSKQELMRWTVANAKIEPRANGIVITKQQSGTAKIDSLMALFNAASLMALNPPTPVKKYNMYS